MIADGTLSFSEGTFQFDQVLKNVSSDTTIFPPLRFTIVSVQSGSGTVRVANADNGGDGVASPAVFDYTSAAGFELVPGETSGARQLKFSNSRGERFSFTATVSGHLRNAGESAGGADSSAAGSSSGTSSGSSSGATGLPAGLPSSNGLIFTVNPLTRSVSVKLL